MNVVIGIIHRHRTEFLVTQRPSSTDHGGLWEFPGGKIEEGEAPFAALQREIKEEVDLNILAAERLEDVSFEYNNKQVTLFVYWVTQFSGEARLCENQLDMRWVPQRELSHYNFPQANIRIIQQIHNYSLHAFS